MSLVSIPIVRLSMSLIPFCLFQTLSHHTMAPADDCDHHDQEDANHAELT